MNSRHFLNRICSQIHRQQWKYVEVQQYQRCGQVDTSRETPESSQVQNARARFILSSQLGLHHYIQCSTIGRVPIPQMGLTYIGKKVYSGSRGLVSLDTGCGLFLLILSPLNADTSASVHTLRPLPEQLFLLLSRLQSCVSTGSQLLGAFHRLYFCRGSCFKLGLGVAQFLEPSVLTSS